MSLMFFMVYFSAQMDGDTCSLQTCFLLSYRLVDRVIQAPPPHTLRHTVCVYSLINNTMHIIIFLQVGVVLHLKWEEKDASNKTVFEHQMDVDLLAPHVPTTTRFDGDILETKEFLKDTKPVGKLVWFYNNEK